MPVLQDIKFPCPHPINSTFNYRLVATMKAILLLAILAVCATGMPASRAPRTPSESSHQHTNEHLTRREDVSDMSSEELKRPVGAIMNPYRNFVDDADAHAVMGE